MILESCVGVRLKKMTGIGYFGVWVRSPKQTGGATGRFALLHDQMTASQEILLTAHVRIATVPLMARHKLSALLSLYCQPARFVPLPHGQKG